MSEVGREQIGRKIKLKALEIQIGIKNFPYASEFFIQFSFHCNLEWSSAKVLQLEFQINF